MARFQLGSKEYPRKRDALEEVRRVLREASVGRMLDGDDLKIIYAVLDRHPAAAEKCAPGVCGITVREFEFRPGIVQRCFFILHPDGTATDFSLLVALGMTPSGPTLAAAGRHAIAGTVHAFKQQHFAGRDKAECTVTGQQVSFAEAHVDHSPPWQFSKIVSAFIAEHGIPPIRDEDGLRTVFCRQEDATSFVSFHDARARLRVVSGRANMAMGARA